MNNINITHVPLNPKGALKLGFIPCGWCTNASSTDNICLTEKCEHYKKWTDRYLKEEK